MKITSFLFAIVYESLVCPFLNKYLLLEWKYAIIGDYIFESNYFLVEDKRGESLIGHNNEREWLKHVFFIFSTHDSIKGWKTAKKKEKNR